MTRVPTSALGERLAVLETELKHITELVEKISERQDVIHQNMLEQHGAWKLGKFVLPGVTAVVGFVSGQLGGIIHLRP